MAEMIGNEANEMTPAVDKMSKKDKFLTGFCVTGAAVGIGHAAWEGGKKLKCKFTSWKESRAEKKAQKAEKKKNSKKD